MSDTPTTPDPLQGLILPGDPPTEDAEATEAAEAPEAARTREQAVAELLAGLRLAGTADQLEKIEAFATDPGE